MNIINYDKQQEKNEYQGSHFTLFARMRLFFKNITLNDYRFLFFV